MEKIHAKMIQLYPRLDWTWVGEIKKRGDIVVFKMARHRAMRMIADKDVMVDSFLKSNHMSEVQSDFRLLANLTGDIADQIVTGLKNIPSGQAFFCGDITEIGIEKRHYIHDVRMRTLFVYGYKSLDPIRLATEIIGECHRQGMSVDEISKELGREFDSDNILWDRAVEAFHR